MGRKPTGNKTKTVGINMNAKMADELELLCVDSPDLPFTMEQICPRLIKN